MQTMIRPYLLLSVALFVVSVPEGLRAQDGRLAGLDEVRIVVESLGSEERKLGLSKDSLRDQVFVFLQGKLPRIRVGKSTYAFIYIRTTALIYKGIKAYAISIELDVRSKVSSWMTKKPIWANVWNTSALIKGPEGEAASHLRAMLDTLLTKFAADWYRDNPAK